MRIRYWPLILATLVVVGCTHGPTREDTRLAQQQHDAFTRLCYESAYERVVRYPEPAKIIYLSRKSSIVGAYEFELFFGVNRPTRWAGADLREGPPPAGTVFTPGTFEVSYLSTPETRQVEGTTLRYEGVTIRIVDLETNQVVAERRNYLWGRDFNRGAECLDTDWFRGNDGFVNRIVGHRWREEARVDTTRRSYVKAVAAGSSLTEVDIKPEPKQSTTVLPPGSSYSYNDRTTTLPNGSKFGGPLYVMGEPVPLLATLENGTDYVFIHAVRSANTWPLRTLMLVKRNKNGVVSEVVFVQLPVQVDWSRGWGFQRGDASIEGGKFRISIRGKKRLTGEFADLLNQGKYSEKSDFVAEVPSLSDMKPSAPNQK